MNLYRGLFILFTKSNLYLSCISYWLIFFIFNSFFISSCFFISSNCFLSILSFNSLILSMPKSLLKSNSFLYKESIGEVCIFSFSLNIEYVDSVPIFEFIMELLYSVFVFIFNLGNVFGIKLGFVLFVILYL